MANVLADPLLAWRAVILYGLNTGTHKMALARCLADFARRGHDHVTMSELAEAFLDVYTDRVLAGRPQLSHPGRLTVMERVITQHQLGTVSREEAISRLEADAFGDVIPRFHTVGGMAVPVSFYERTDEGIVLTDAVFRLMERPDAGELDAERDARWDLLEAAFELKRSAGTLGNDIRVFYIEHGYDRRSVTHLRSVLHGYQAGRCFYCGEPIGTGDGHVDHVIPRQFLMHDEPWNLVLAHGLCNLDKSDALPGDRYVEQLVNRNEHLIMSNHPLKRHIMAQLGSTPDQRRRAVVRVYEDAKQVIPTVWSQLRGYDPGSDPLLKAIVRSQLRSQAR